MLSACVTDSEPLSAARLRGFEQDLHLTDGEFDTVLSILYVTRHLVTFSTPAHKPQVI